MKQKKYANVWDALSKSPTEAANMKARSALMVAIENVVVSWKTTQADAAKRLGLTQPRLNDLLRGRITKFSLDALMAVAERAGLTVRVTVVRKAA